MNNAAELLDTTFAVAFVVGMTSAVLSIEDRSSTSCRVSVSSVPLW